MAPVSEQEVESVLLWEQRFSEVASACDQLELEAATYGRLPAYAPLYAIQLLGHLYNDDTTAARFLWKRIPPPVRQQHPEIAAAWRVGQAFWQHDPAGVHAALRGHAWGPQAKLLADALAVKYTEKTLALLQKAYSSILAGEAGTLLGLSNSEAAAALERSGWKLDPASSSYHFDATSKTAPDVTVLNQVQKLTEYVFHLEQ